MAAPSEAVSHSSPYYGQALKNDEIRLLTIIWTRSGLELRTECHKISEDLEFDAISYVWGTAPASCPIRCNSKPLSITSTALEMIWYLYFYRPEPKRPIWIDAICINQHDADEKAVQVPQMHRIFSHAYSVIVWMGRSTFETTVFMTSISQIPEPWDSEPATSEIDRQWPYIDDPFWTGMYQLLSNDWFLRLWTFQEIVLAKTSLLLCGKFWLDFVRLLEVASQRYFTSLHPFDQKRLVDHHVVSQCYYILECRGRGSMKAQEIPWILNAMRHRHVGEEVDRIWAMYGLFSKDVQEQLAPLVDYSAAARKQHWLTLIACMKVLVQMSQRLDLLDIPPSADSKPQYLPSWCPDVRERAITHRLLDGFWNENIQDDPNKSREIFTEEEVAVTCSRRDAVYEHAKRYISVAPEDDVLSIHGFEVDTITEVVEDARLIGVWDYSEDYHNVLQNFSNENSVHVIAMRWITDSLSLAHRTYQQPCDDSPELPWEFLSAFWTDHRIDGNAMTAYHDAMKALLAGDYEMIFSLSEEKERDARSCTSRFRYIVGHSFFSTTGGRFGLATPGCKPGDKVCVFYGGAPLYTIRPHDIKNHPVRQDTEKLWEFVGTAYVPHLMDQHTTDDARQGPDQIYALA